MNKKKNMTRFIYLWALIGLISLTVLSWSLHKNANPWKLVHTIPGDTAKSPHSRSHPDGGYGTRQLMDVSPDGKKLLLSRPNGTVELWDLNQFRKLETFHKAKHPANDKLPEYDSPKYVSFSQNGNGILIGYDGFNWDVINETEQPRHINGHTYFETAEMDHKGRRVVFADLSKIRIYDISNDRVIWEKELERVNGGRRRLQWSADDCYVMLNDYLGLRIFDARSGKLLFNHGELDLSVPPPYLSDENSGLRHLRRKLIETGAAAGATYESARRHIAALSDSQLPEDGETIITLYEPMDPCSKPPEASRIRSYSVSEGAILWDEQLTGMARFLHLSPDGSLAYALDDGFHNYPHQAALFTFDVQKHTLMQTTHLEMGRVFPPSLCAFPDNRFVALSADNDTWIIDTTEKKAPIRLKGEELLRSIAIADEGKLLIDLGVTGTTRFWQLSQQ